MKLIIPAAQELRFKASGIPLCISAEECEHSLAKMVLIPAYCIGTLQRR
jgi:hypothetical protein